MPVFISYSHQDKRFVDRLAAQLVRQKVNVWLDRWELKVGDSLISKVQDAIVGASALLVILSESARKVLDSDESVVIPWSRQAMLGRDHVDEGQSTAL